ncbi:MAG: DUF2442 domain-containing protein [Anaerolineales bacterium]|nr:DUF2442 domain-containing protein [Anaerolineales bacterium]
MNTLAKLYLGSEPADVRVDEDQLLIVLADGRTVAIPLSLVSQLDRVEALPTEAQILVLRRPPQIDHIHVTDSALNVYLKDGRLLSCPLAWFPRLLHGSPAERNHYELNGDDNIIHWPELDEDIELTRLFEGGRSLESERSLQRWLISRQPQMETATAD